MYPPRTPRSPFLIIPEFISPLTCEEIIGEVDFNGLSLDQETGAPLCTTKTSVVATRFVEGVVEDTGAQQIERYFNVNFDSVESCSFEWYYQGYKPKGAAPDGYARHGTQWVKSNVSDFVGVLFLMDHAESQPDLDFEVVGGKLEFPSFNFGFKPQAGTLVVFPSAPNFANATAAIRMGELFQVRILMSTVVPYRYDPREFPGTYQDWYGR